MIDRERPARPEGPAGGEQRWRELLFLHWPVAAAELRALVPAELELDLWHDTALVGLVPFEMQGVRPSWLPRPAAQDFLEANVRVYVRHRDRAGVYFLSLEAASAAACAVARLTFGLPYFWASMRREHDRDLVRYDSRRRIGPPAHLRVVYRPGADLGASRVGTLQHFLLERYYLFVEREGRILCGQVHHEPYPARAVELIALEQSLVGAAGLHVSGAPAYAHWSPGVDVEVFDLVAT